MREIIKKKWEYTLYEKDSQLVLSVLCGTVGLFNLNLFLNEEESQSYQNQGEEFIKKLAAQIRDDPQPYSCRHIDLKTLTCDK